MNSLRHAQYNVYLIITPILYLIITPILYAIVLCAAGPIGTLMNAVDTLPDRIKAAARQMAATMCNQTSLLEAFLAHMKDFDMISLGGSLRAIFSELVFYELGVLALVSALCGWRSPRCC